MNQNDFVHVPVMTPEQQEALWQKYKKMRSSPDWISPIMADSNDEKVNEKNRIQEGQ